MLKSRLIDYGHVYIDVSGALTVKNTGAANNNSSNTAANNTIIQAVFENCTPFTNCINKINNAEIGNAKDIDVVIPMFNLIEFSDHYSKKISTFMVTLERLTIFK